MGTLHGTIIDAVSGESLDAKVHVLNASGNFSRPPNSMLKRGPGTPFFFCDGAFAVEGSRGRTECAGRARHGVRTLSHDC